MSRRNFGPVVALWGVFLAILAAVGVIAFPVHVEQPALLGGGAVLVLVAGFAITAATRASASPRFTHPTDISPPTAWLGVSIALLALSASLGFWLTLIGAGMCGVGLGALFLERRAERERFRAARLEAGIPARAGRGSR